MLNQSADIVAMNYIDEGMMRWDQARSKGLDRHFLRSMAPWQPISPLKFHGTHAREDVIEYVATFLSAMPITPPETTPAILPSAVDTDPPPTSGLRKPACTAGVRLFH